MIISLASLGSSFLSVRVPVLVPGGLAPALLQVALLDHRPLIHGRGIGAAPALGRDPRQQVSGPIAKLSSPPPALLRRRSLCLARMALSTADYRQALLAAETELQSARSSVAEWLITHAPAITDLSAYARTVAPSLETCERQANELRALLDDPRVRC